MKDKVLRQVLELREQEADLRSRADRADGKLERELASLADYGVASVGEGKKLAKKLRGEREALEVEFAEDLAGFREKWPDYK